MVYPGGWASVAEVSFLHGVPTFPDDVRGRRGNLQFHVRRATIQPVPIPMALWGRQDPHAPPVRTPLIENCVSIKFKR